jgi:hypothetical protein
MRPALAVSGLVAPSMGDLVEEVCPPGHCSPAGQRGSNVLCSTLNGMARKPAFATARSPQ